MPSFFSKQIRASFFVVLLVLSLATPRPAEAFIHKTIGKALKAVVDVVVAVVVTVTAPIVAPIATITGNREEYRCFAHGATAPLGSPIGAASSCPSSSSSGFSGSSSFSGSTGFGGTAPSGSGLFGAFPQPTGTDPLMQARCSFAFVAPDCCAYISPTSLLAPFQRQQCSAAGVATPGFGTGFSGTPTIPGATPFSQPGTDPFQAGPDGAPAEQPVVIVTPTLTTTFSRPLKVTFIADRPTQTNNASLSLVSNGASRPVTLILATTNIQGVPLTAYFDGVQGSSKNFGALPIAASFKLSLARSLPTGKYPFTINALDGARIVPIAGVVEVTNLDPRLRER